MTVRVERSFVVGVDCDLVWRFISDPEKRARAISVVSDFQLEDESGRRATWYIRLPIPFVRKTIPVRTTELERVSGEYVRFVGESAVLHVTGEHRLVKREDGCHLTNTFVVDGYLPGVERFFKRNLDKEFRNLEHALRVDLGTSDRHT